MKKLFSILSVVALATSFSASADIYVCGSGEGLGWDPANPYVVTASADGSYEFTIAQLSSFKMSTASGSWDDFNAGAMSVDGGNVSAPGTFALVPWGENTMLPWIGSWTVKVNSEMNQATFSTTTPRPDSAVLYLRGSMNEWGAVDDWKFETTDGEHYVLNDKTLTTAYTFKVADAGWGTYNFGSVRDMVPDTSYTLTRGSSSGDCSIAQDFTGNITFNLTTYEFRLESSTGIEGIETAEDAPAVYYNMQGVRVDNPENGMYIVRRGGKTFKTVIR